MYNIGDIVELESGKKCFVYDYINYANMNFAFLHNIEDEDDFDVYESIINNKEIFFKKIRDRNFKRELYTILYNKM